MAHVLLIHSDSMRKKRFNSVAISVLILLVVYAGAAWALEGCLVDNGRSETFAWQQRSPNYRLVKESWFDRINFPRVPNTRIHCVGSAHRLPLTAENIRAVSAKPSRERGIVKSFLSEGMSSSAKIPLTGNGINSQSLKISLPTVFPHHLILSVLRI
jgi:hypothetical protein